MSNGVATASQTNPSCRLQTILPLRTVSTSSGCCPQAMPTRAKIHGIFMPTLSSTMTKGQIVSWIKSEGDKLAKGESVVIVESNKADMNVEIFHEGILAPIMVEEGGVTPIKSAVALLTKTEDEITKPKAKASLSSSGAQSSPEQPKPKLDEEAPVTAAPSFDIVDFERGRHREELNC